MPYCHQHEQQRYHNENSKICMFIHYMHVYNMFPLTKAIPIMFERIPTHYQTLKTWIGQCVTTCVTVHSSSLTWLGYNATCYSMLPYILSF